VIVAKPGHELIVADLSNVEGRGTAWIAGEEWKLAAFLEYDRVGGHDLYVLAYARAFGVDPATVTKAQRQVGKVFELMLGYGGGVGAFVTGAATYRVDLATLAKAAWPQIPFELQEETRAAYGRALLQGDRLADALGEEVFCACWALTRLWRRANPQIVSYWYELEQVIREVIVDGTPRRVRGLVEVSKLGAWLRLQLPSGRYLNYASPRLEGEQIIFWGLNNYTRQWDWQKLWGGLATENISQGLCRDVLAGGLLNAHEAGAHPVLHVHDEIVLEEPEGTVKPSMLEHWMTVPLGALGWTHGLPLSAKGFKTCRYHKEV
jgi:DNA polymerase